VLAAEDRFAPIGGAMFLLGVVFGSLTAITSDSDLAQTWLLIGYALTVFILVYGVTYHRTQAPPNTQSCNRSLPSPSPRRGPSLGPTM
jgi:hypothetical protein